MRLPLHELETTADAIEDAAGAGTDVEAGADTAAADVEGAAETETASEAAPAWTPDDPAFQRAIAEATRAQLEQLVREAEWEQLEQEDEPGVEFDPFSDNPGEQLAALIRAELQQALAPLSPMVEETQNQWAQQQVDGIIDSFTDLGADFQLKAEDGTPLEGEQLEQARATREAAQRMASGFMPNLPGNAPPWARQQAVQQALRQGAEQVKQIRDTAFKAGEEAYKARLAGISGTQDDTGVTGAGMESTGPTTSYDEIIARHASRSRAEVFNT